MLLHWGTIQPQGASNLASVRFAGPVRIRAIRIYPQGASLFVQNPQAVSETEPSAFSLSVFLTAQSAPTAQDPKPRGTNVLVPTRLPYVGGLQEFPLDMGPDFVTRLMVMQGDYTHVTFAVYGDLISDPVDTPIMYKPISLPNMSRRSLSSALDFSNSTDPYLLSRDLLARSPESPSLSLVIRLVCCLREPDGFWDSAMIPYPDLDIDTDLSSSDWLAKATDTLMVPVSHDVDPDVLKKFANKASQVASANTDDVLHMIVGLIKYASAQPAPVIVTILDNLSLSQILEVNFLDQHILNCLCDAAANPSVARAFRSTPVIERLQSLRDADSASQALKNAAINLLHRILGWERFEKALSSPMSDVPAVVRWIKELASDDMSFGVFILSMIEDESLGAKLMDHPLQEQASPPPALWTSKGLVSLSEFVAVMRAFVGISSVLVVLCWSVHVSDAQCTERILAMIRLWQEVDGYREVVNHLLLVPQLIYHLETMLKYTPSSPPSMTLVHLEQILVCLVSQPETMVRPEIAALVNLLPDPPASIPENEQLDMGEISRIASGGLSDAAGTVLNWSNRPVDNSSARALQAALLILEVTLDDRGSGEWMVMQAAWQEGSHALMYCLVDIFHSFVTPIRSQFSLTPPPHVGPETFLRLLTSANSILRIFFRLLPAYPLPSRVNRQLSRDIASLFIATDAVDSRYFQGGAICQAARVARPTCAEVIAVLSAVPDESKPGCVSGEVVLQTLLQNALYPEGDDPVTRLEQTFWLLDLVLPLPSSDSSGDRTEQRLWMRNIMPNVLSELRQFMRSLAVDQQIQLVKRLADLDRGEVGLVQWFVDEELKFLNLMVDSLSDSHLDLDRDSILHTRISNSFQFLSELVEATSDHEGNSEFFQEIRTLEDISHVLSCLLDDRVTISSVLDFAGLLATAAPFMETQVQLDLALTLFRGAGGRPSAFIHAVTFLSHMQQGEVRGTDVSRVASELGPALQRAVDSSDWQSSWQQEESRMTRAIVSSLYWLIGHSKMDTVLLPGITEACFKSLMERLEAAALESDKIALGLFGKFIFSDDVVLWSASEEAGSLVLSIDRLVELMTPQPVAPSTPRLSGESIFKMATLSPITALAGTSKISTLTKTYQNNDFRQLSVRQNTSRRPSMHVDDFEQGSTDLGSPAAVQPSPPAPMIATDYFQLLPPSKTESE